ncbi:MAG: hypothetical protein KDI13_05515 [Alphaproteobacteria bacterium]|nr:hypothetical protein [Alphaproteobacteria bacterium]
MKILRHTLGYNLALPSIPESKLSRRERVRQIVQHANTSVPFYQGRFDSFLAEEQSLTDSEFFYAFSHLPFVTKQNLKDHNEAFRSETLNGKFDLLNEGKTPNTKDAIIHGLVKKDFFTSISTGGTSGIPTYRWLDYEDANVFAQSFLHSFKMNGWKQGESFVVYYPLKSYFTGPYAEFSGPLNTLFGFTMVPFETVTKESVENLLKTLKKRKATLLVIFPCVLQRVAEIMKAENIPPFEGLRYINVSGEFFLDCSKKFIQKMFPGADIQSTYGAVEFGEIAHQSGLSSFDYDVFSDYAYIEQGPGNSILVTALRQKAFPFIRYQIEDMGQVVTEADGRQSILHLEGKNTDYIIGADGYHYYASFFNAVINEINTAFDDPIMHFMLRHDKNALQLNFVLQNPEQEKNVEQAARDTMQAIFPNYSKVEIIFRDHFDHDYTRKFKIIGEGDGLAEVVGGYYQQKKAS